MTRFGALARGSDNAMLEELLAQSVSQSAHSLQGGMLHKAVELDKGPQ